MGAVSKEVRKQALREQKECQASGSHAGTLEAAHYNHIKDDKKRAEMGLPPYNSKNSVRILCTQHHLEDHLEHEGQNGLTPKQNEWAIGRIGKRLFLYLIGHQNEP